MPTQRYTLTPDTGWTEVAATGQDYLVENVGGTDCELTLQDAPPTGADTPSHWLRRGQAMVRVGSGAAYVRATGQSTIVTVTT